MSDSASRHERGPTEAETRAEGSEREGDGVGAADAEPPRGAWYLVAAFFRWLYLAVAFMVVGALVFTLYEANSFQQQVGRLAATSDIPARIAQNDWERMLFLAVREADRWGCPATTPKVSAKTPAKAPVERETEETAVVPADAEAAEVDAEGTEAAEKTGPGAAEASADAGHGETNPPQALSTGSCYPPEFVEQAPWPDAVVFDPDDPQSDPRVSWIRLGLQLTGEHQVGAVESELYDEDVARAVALFRQSELNEKSSDADDVIRRLLIDKVKEASRQCAQEETAAAGETDDRGNDAESQSGGHVSAPRAPAQDDPVSQEDSKASAGQSSVARVDPVREQLQPIVDVMLLGEPEPDSGPIDWVIAASMLRAYQDLDRFHFFLMPFQDRTTTRCGGGFGVNGKDLAVASRAAVDLMVVFLMGAVGSLIYVTQYLLLQVIHGRPITEGAGRSVAWILFRPIFGMTIAFALFLLYKAGQIALGAGGGTALSADVNLPVLGTLSLFAGLLSWQVLDMVKARGARFLASAKRDRLWATGLAAAMRDADVTASALAKAIGVSEEQVERWLELVDRVSPEMQDRIVDHLALTRGQLFSDQEPLRDRRPQMATGLASVMTEQGLSANTVGRRMNLAPDVIERWRACETPVPARYQAELIRVLDSFEAELFPADDGATNSSAGSADEAVDGQAAKPLPSGEQVEPPADVDASDPRQDGEAEEGLWAAGLRLALFQSTMFGGSAALADHLQVEPDAVRDWMELRAPVPADLQEALSRALQTEVDRLFTVALPGGFMRVVDVTAFHEALANFPAPLGETESERVAKFEQVIDVNQGEILLWLSGTEKIAPETAARVLYELTDGEPAPFLGPAD